MITSKIKLPVFRVVVPRYVTEGRTDPTRTRAARERSITRRYQRLMKGNA